MNIAIYGGSFDPPHIGHEKIVNKSLEILNIKKLVIVPTFLNPFKKNSHFSPSTRLKLINKLFNKKKKIKISDFEILNKKPTATIKTIKHYKDIYKPKKIFLIIGADNARELHLWQDFEELIGLVEVVVISRNGYEAKNDIIRFININMDVQVSSTQLREDLVIDYIPKKIQKKVKKLWNKE